MPAPAKTQALTLSDLPQLWQLSFQKTTRGISIVDPRTTLVRAVNPSFARMHGGEPEDFVGKPLATVLTPQAAARIPAIAAEVERNDFAAFESVHVRLDGSTFPVATEMISARDDYGRVMYRIGWFTDLSERSRAERQQREAERQFETAFAGAAIGMALVGLDGRCLRTNAVFRQLTGYSEEELRQLDIGEITHPDDLEPTLENDARLLSGGADDYSLEKRYLRKGGEPVWVRIFVSLHRDDDGAPVHYIVHADDISLRKLMEADLSQAAGESHVTRDLMCMTSSDGRLDRLGGRWKEVLGWTEKELRASELIDFVHPEDREGTMAAWSELCGSEAGLDGEWRTFRNRWKTKNGHWSWLSWSGIALPALGRIFCTVREVNDRVAMERTLDLRGEVIANMAEGVCLITMNDGRIVYANPSLEEMLGHGPGELTGREAVDAIRPTDLSPEEEALRSAAEAELREHGRASYEGRRLRKDGSTIWCRTMTTAFDHPRYGLVWIAVQQDISEERRARDAAEKLEQAKTEFLSSVSHELRTPLTSILGYAALLREDAAGLGEARDHIEVIERNASRQLRLVEDLLSIARIQAGEFEVHKLPIDLAEVVLLGAEGLRPAAEEAGLRLEIECDGPVRALGDSDRLAQVVANLVSNAIKFTPPDGRIDVTLRATEDEALLTVSDTGPGIRPAERARLFERMFRGDDVRRLQITGAGLGLAIARSIVEAHEGRIDVSADGDGATFEVTIPLTEAEL
jgi:PAS domain S-box-containing protein